MEPGKVMPFISNISMESNIFEQTKLKASGGNKKLKIAMKQA